MPFCVFDKSTGQFLSGLMHTPLTIDPATQIQVELAAYPDPRLQRLNLATNMIRNATASEIQAFDDSQMSPLDRALDVVIQSSAPSTAQLKAVFQLLRQRFTRGD